MWMIEVNWNGKKWSTVATSLSEAFSKWDNHPDHAEAMALSPCSLEDLMLNIVIANKVQDTPEPARWGTRAKPLTGEDLYAAFKWILDNHQCHKINGPLVDATTASVVCQVADKLNPENRAKLLALPITKIAHVCFCLIA